MKRDIGLREMPYKKEREEVAWESDWERSKEFLYMSDYLNTLGVEGNNAFIYMFLVLYVRWMRPK